MYQPRIHSHTRVIDLSLSTALAQTGLANVEWSIEVGVREMVEHLLGTGVGESVGV